MEFDATYTAEDIGSYKPDPRNFDYMLAHLAARGIAREQILHTAESLYHDHVPAKRVGLATCWIHRRAGKAGHGATRSRRPRSAPTSASRPWAPWRRRTAPSRSARAAAGAARAGAWDLPLRAPVSSSTRKKKAVRPSSDP